MRYENAPDPEAERQKTRNRYIPDRHFRSYNSPQPDICGHVWWYHTGNRYCWGNPHPCRSNSPFRQWFSTQQQDICNPFPHATIDYYRCDPLPSSEHSCR